MRWPFKRRRTTVLTGGLRSAPADALKLDPQSAYALWAPTYPPRPHNALMEIEQEAMLALFPDVRGLMILDAGCGSGRYLRELEARGATAIGMDLSAAMLARAHEVTPKIARADIRALPFDAMSIDMVVCGLALGDLPELELALSEMARVLRPGGLVIYSVVHPAGEAEGWSRSFESGGRQCAIDSHWHSLDRHRQACTAADLTIDGWREPALAVTPAQPAVLVVRAVNARRTTVEPS
jgi:malonyl-CoA O-methyltransferase